MVLLKTAAEIIVKVNGKYVGGIDPNRERMLLTPYIGDNKIKFDMQGYNRSNPMMKVIRSRFRFAVAAKYLTARTS